jgi:hypothetical protein
LQTANFANNAQAQFDALMQLQPDKALMAMEFWTGWFDHWMQGYHDSGNSPQRKFYTLCGGLSLTNTNNN